MQMATTGLDGESRTGLKAQRLDSFIQFDRRMPLRHRSTEFLFSVSVAVDAFLSVYHATETLKHRTHSISYILYPFLRAQFLFSSSAMRHSYCGKFLLSKRSQNKVPHL